MSGKRAAAEDWGYKTEERNKGPIKTNWSSSPRPFIRHSVRRFDRSDKFCGRFVRRARTFAGKRHIILLKFIKALARNVRY